MPVRPFARAIVLSLAVAQAGARADGLPSMKAPGRAAPLKLMPDEVADFEKIVANDPVVHPMARSLATRRRAGTALEVIGALVAVGLAVPGALTWESCKTRMDMTLDCAGRDRSVALVVSGGVVGLGLFLLGWAVAPSRGDFTEAMRAWNGRHADAPLELR